MSFFRRYFAYLQDNPQGYWFRRKAYGWGWVPARWQGWASLAVFLLIYVCILVPFVEYVATHSQLDPKIIVCFLGKIGLWIAALIGLCYLTGEPPKWQWGIPESRK